MRWRPNPPKFFPAVFWGGVTWALQNVYQNLECLFEKLANTEMLINFFINC